jgi:hypothetical protein
MRWLLLVLLSGCATHDALRAEPVVARAVCSAGLAIYGYPVLDGPACDSEVASLGDGCYVAVRPDEQTPLPRQILALGNQLVPWIPHLLECSPNPLDQHIMCVEDPLGRRGHLFGEDITRVSRNLTLPYTIALERPATTWVTTGRCRERFLAWELAYVPAPPSPPFITTYWSVAPVDTKPNVVGKSVDVQRLHFRVEEDAISLGRILSQGSAMAVMCPGPTGPRVEVEPRIPSRLAQRLATVFARAVTEGGLVLSACARVTMAFTPVREEPVAFRAFARPLPLPR